MSLTAHQTSCLFLKASHVLLPTPFNCVEASTAALLPSPHIQVCSILINTEKEKGGRCLTLTKKQDVVVTVRGNSGHGLLLEETRELRWLCSSCQALLYTQCQAVRGLS